jgi:hypothetical protein
LGSVDVWELTRRFDAVHRDAKRLEVAAVLPKLELPLLSVGCVPLVATV